MTTETSGGAYGKFRKKPSRRTQTTPYDRPPSTLRPTQLVGVGEREKNGWLSKIVDPASRLITAGAHKLFSSVFRKRLLPSPPPPPQDEMTETRDAQPEITTKVGSFGTKEQVCKGNDPSRASVNDGVADLEDILKQKTFTRSEIDHLTALLLSRTVGNLVEEEKGRFEPNSSDEKAGHSRHETLTTLPAIENGAEHVVLDDVASPAELAKAYMGSRPSRASPPVLGLQNEMPREDLSAPYNPFFKPKSPAMSLIQKPSSEIGASANGFMTPRYRGRSVIYSMARTPYSRPHPTEVYKAAEIASDVHGASLSSRHAMEGQRSGSKRQVLKRRSSVMENDMGFVGPIRRIRQKPNLLHHKTLSLPASGAHIKHESGGLTDVTHIPASADWSSNLQSSSKALVDNDMPSTSNSYVPIQSIETAQKIFQHLDSFSSKGKSPENKFDIVGGSSPGKPTSESLKVFQTIQDSRKENGLVDSSIALEHSLKTSKWAGIDSVQKVVIPLVEDGVEAGSRNKTLDNTNSRPSFDHQQKKQAFRMSAHEDYLELDDVLTNGVVPTPRSEGVEGSELAKSSAVFSENPSQSEAILAGKPMSSQSNPSPSFLVSNKEGSPPDESAAAQKITGHTFPSGSSTLFTTSMSTQAVSSPLSTAEVKKVAEQSEKIVKVTANSLNSPKVALFSFSPSSFVLDSAPTLDIKPEFSSSASDAANKADESDKTDKNNTLLLGNASKKMEGMPSLASSAKGLFSYGVQSNGATSSNELSSAVTMGMSSPIPFSSISNNQSPVHVSVSSSPSLSISNGNTLSTSIPTTSAEAMVNIDSTGCVSTSGSSSSQFSASAPSFSFGSNNQFGSPAIPSTSAAVSFGMESVANSGAKSTETAFGNVTNLFNAKTAGTACVGTNISGFDASTIKSASIETQTLPAAIFSSQVSTSSVAFTTSTQNVSSQSASSVTPVFGFSASTSVNASTIANPFTSGFGSASSVYTPSVTAPVSSGNNTSSNLFGLQSSKPTFPGSTFGTSSQSTGFPFGSTASGTSAANNSTQFVFGAASSSSAVSNNTSLAFGATTPSSSAAGASTSMFGATSSSSAANSAKFTFGASSSAASIFSIPSAVGSTPPSSTPFLNQPAFGNSNPQPFGFGLTPPVGNNDRVNMEDSMAEDSVQVSTPAVPAFGLPIAAPSSNPFGFNGAAPSTGSPFQFAGQQNQIAPQNNTPFQPSGSLEFNAGGAGSFSLGSGGVDKANRRIVKVNRKGVRRK